MPSEIVAPAQCGTAHPAPPTPESGSSGPASGPLSAPLPVVLFDLDGTIVDSAPGIVASFHEALAAVGARAPKGDVASHIVGPPMLDTLRGLGLDDERIDRAFAAYVHAYDREGWSRTTVFDGLADVLARVGEVSRVALATSKAEHFAERILERAGLLGHFAFVGGASPDGTRRAKVDVVAHALRGVGVEPVPASEGGTPGVVMIGDRDHDVTGAAAWGVPTVGVRWGYGSDDELSGATTLVSTPDELTALLTGLPTRDPSH